MYHSKVWEIFGFEGCSYCDKAVEFLKEKEQVVHYVDIKKTPNMKQLMLQRVPEAKTVPQVFLHRLDGPLFDSQTTAKTTHVGGCDDLLAKYEELVAEGG